MFPIPTSFQDRAIWLYSSLDWAPNTVWSMWIGVKHQLDIMTVDSDTVGVLRKMPHIFTNAEYAAMLYIYCFCDCSANAAIEEYCQQFPMHRTPDREVFSGEHCMKTACTHITHSRCKINTQGATPCI